MGCEYNENVPFQPIFFARQKKGKREEIDYVWPVNESSLPPPPPFFFSFFLFFLFCFIIIKRPSVTTNCTSELVNQPDVGIINTNGRPLNARLLNGG